jgi:hypothetical protein
MKKKTLIIFVLLALFSASCYALLPGVIGFIRFITPISSSMIARAWPRLAVTDPVFVRALELSAYTHAAIMSIHWSTTPVSNNGTELASSAIHAILSGTDEQRQNPDPDRWNDPSAGSYDVTPKEQIPRGSGGNITQQIPNTWPAVVDDIGGSGDKYYVYNATNDAHVIVLFRPNGFCTGYQNDAPTGYAGQWCGQRTNISSTGAFAVYFRAIPTSCPAGYSISGSFCILQDVQQVMKPAETVPCEVVYDSNRGVWDVDMKNPECVNFINALQDGSIVVDGNTIRVTDNNGDTSSVTRNPDGGFTVTTPTTDGGTSTVVTQPRDPNAGGSGRPGFPIGSITVTPPGGGGNGNGGGSCGGPNQPPCKVDDSGFNDLNPDWSKEVERANQERQDYIGGLGDQGNFGVDNSWIPSFLPGAPVQCTALEWPITLAYRGYVLLNDVARVDICDKVDIFRQYLAWLFSFITLVAVAKLFFTSNEGGA